MEDFGVVARVGDIALSSMSRPPDIDTLFHFDPYEGLTSGATGMQLKPESEFSAQDITPPMSSHDESSTSGELGELLVQPTIAKGKERTKPVPIRASSIVYDLFDSSPSVAYASSSSSTAFSPSSFSFSSPGFDDSRYRQRSLSVDSMEQLDASDIESSSLNSPPLSKGKEREPIPLLPPLTFSLIQLDPDRGVLPTSCQSPYDRLYSPSPKIDSHSSLPSPANQVLPSLSLTESSSSENGSQDVTKRAISRSQSFSTLSQQISPPPGAFSTFDRLSTAGPSRTPSNLSLIFEKRDNNPSTSFNKSIAALTPTTSASPPVIDDVESRDCSAFDWYAVQKPCGLPIIRTQPSATPSLPEHLLLNSSTNILLKGKFRSMSSPYPLSALDLVPITTTDIFQPFPIVIRNYFDFSLPKELRLHIFRALLHIHEQDYLRLVNSGRLTVAKASSSKSRWVGKDKGIRELFKLSRVSKSWQELVFDGQLWADLDLHSFPGLPSALIARLIKSTGTFIQSLNLAGHVQLVPENMTEIVDYLSHPHSTPRISLCYTQLTSINLQGCTGLTTRNLHHLLVRSRSLQILSVKGLDAVTNTTCDIISNFCPQIAALNMSRCNNMDASGIQALAVAAINRRKHLLLKELRLSGLKYVTDSMMAALGKAAPDLEVLDLSYARQLHNSALDAFVASDGHEDGMDLGVEMVTVTARDLGRELNNVGKLIRRVTRLRHLVLSSCLLLTDTACANLAFSVPKLEFLELAGLGAGLKDDGLIRLLSSTPYIRRLDLEDAIDITDDVLTAITPYTETILTKNGAEEDKQPGHVLQQLIISFATSISDSAFLALIRQCPCLTVLEADSTRMSSAVLKEFIHLSRQRKAINAKIVAVDCRGISESLVKELSPMTRPRLGWRAYGARKLWYLDARDDIEEILKIGQDECDEYRVVLKSFYSWQTVDAVKVVMEKRKRSTRRRTGSDSSNGPSELDPFEPGQSTTRWWSPGGRRATRIGAGRTLATPILPDLNNDGCRTM